jgi:hypothetical protein
MGLTANGLGPSDQGIVKSMGPEIVSQLRDVSAKIRVGDRHSQIWFGDSTAQWITQLRTKLNRMASVINLKTIEIHGTARNQRDKKNFAAAYEPAAGWRDNTANVGGRGFITRSQGQDFEIELDFKWNSSPKYRVITNYDSKFQILVHELTHLIIHTEDEAYGSIKCRALAITSPQRAKRNADSWSYFLEDFR